MRSLQPLLLGGVLIFGAPLTAGPVPYDFVDTTLQLGGTVTGSFDFTPGIGFTNINIAISATGVAFPTNDNGVGLTQDPTGADYSDAYIFFALTPSLETLPASVSTFGEYKLGPPGPEGPISGVRVIPGKFNVP